jgi:hypothetical protein
VTRHTKRLTLRAAARRAVAAGLALASPLIFACANLGAPPAQLGGFEPYRVNGRTYVPLHKWERYKEIGSRFVVRRKIPRSHHGERRALR